MTRITDSSTWLRPLVLLAAAPFFAGPARADIDLRVQSRPTADPIRAFVKVSDGSGSVTGLTSADFAVTIDGNASNTFAFGLPADQDPMQRTSIVFVIDYSRSVQSLVGDAIRDSVTDFINQMAVGDYAAIVKFRISVLEPDLAPVVLPFTQIDQGTGTNMLIDFVADGYRGGLTGLFDGIALAVDQFVTSPAVLPNGPKAIILIDDGMDLASFETYSHAVAHANGTSVPIFTVGLGDIAAYASATALMESLAEETGGTYIAATDKAQIAAALATITALLHSVYLLTIPPTTVIDCDPHMLEVTSQGQAARIAFTRCDITPDNFYFTDQSGVAPGAVVVSDTVTITGIDSPATVAVTGGEYSIGCGSMFTSAPGFIFPDDEVCVRHTASANRSTSASTMLVVGGVASRFTSTTSAAPPPTSGGGDNSGSGGGGGGAVGVLELLFGLGALFARKRRYAR